MSEENKYCSDVMKKTFQQKNCDDYRRQWKF